MKKSFNLLALCLVISLMAMLTACGGGSTNTDNDDAGTSPTETMNENAPNADDDGDDDGDEDGDEEDGDDEDGDEDSD
jgi:hypothetical protein